MPCVEHLLGLGEAAVCLLGFFKVYYYYERERTKWEMYFSFAVSLPKMAAIARAVPESRQESGTPSWPSKW